MRRALALVLVTSMALAACSETGGGRIASDDFEASDELADAYEDLVGQVEAGADPLEVAQAIPSAWLPEDVDRDAIAQALAREAETCLGVSASDLAAPLRLQPYQLALSAHLAHGGRAQCVFADPQSDVPVAVFDVYDAASPESAVDMVRRRAEPDGAEVRGLKVRVGKDRRPVDGLDVVAVTDRLGRLWFAWGSTALRLLQPDAIQGDKQRAVAEAMLSELARIDGLEAPEPGS